jgi:uncharacterized membrane protein YraQ (UPF0718 family)
MPDSIWMQMLTVIWDEIANMWWFFLLSIVLVGIIKGYKLDLRIRDSINRAGPWGIVLAVGVGMVSPLCSCGILPVVITLAMVQTPLAPLMALLVTSPVMGPDALILTWSALGTEWAVLKVVGAGALGLSAGLVTQLLINHGYLAGNLIRLKPKYKEDGTLAPAKEIGAEAGIHVKSMTIVPRASKCVGSDHRNHCAGVLDHGPGRSEELSLASACGDYWFAAADQPAADYPDYGGLVTKRY